MNSKKHSKEMLGELCVCQIILFCSELQKFMYQEFLHCNSFNITGTQMLGEIKRSSPTKLKRIL
jgi:hypothetical protein